LTMLMAFCNPSSAAMGSIEITPKSTQLCMYQK